jgi:LysR family hydrogen peroxide-inducible transcriptional activator
MRPTLRQLQYLVAIADTGRFVEAAKRLNVSQPSLSTQLAEMEAELSCALVERGRHGAFLTPIGEDVARRARFILSEVEDMKAVARDGVRTGGAYSAWGVALCWALSSADGNQAVA